MINGVSIPVFTPYKFYPASSETGDGINFQNVDNTGRTSQDWEGIYPGIFLQPVPRYWNDLSPGLDFQIYMDTSVLAFADLKAALIKSDVVTSNDWFLGSRNDNIEMYNELKAHGVGAFANAKYWSSSEWVTTPADYAYSIDFTGGGVTNDLKTESFRVRAIRTFTDIVGAYSLRDVGPAGGLIFHIDGTTYYEAAPSDQSTGKAWSNITDTEVTGTSQAIGTGQSNTTAIINQVGHTDSAAKLCDDLVLQVGVIVQDLVTEDFFTYSGTLKQIRIYASSFIGIEDGCYRIKLYEAGGDDIYYSEIIQIADSFDDCYPLEFSNFENAFGMIFTNAASDTWVGKVLIPIRMLTPAPVDDRNVYQNDNGELTTLRSVPRRVYIIESFPVAMWFAEKVKLWFSCSGLVLNKMNANSEDLSIKTLPETDLMEINGNIQLNDFTEFLQTDELDSTTELLTSWTANGATVGDWTTFTASGKDILTGLYEAAGIATAFSNNFNVVDENYYLVDLTLSSAIVTFSIEIDGDSFDLELGRNVIIYKAHSTGAVKIDLFCGQDSDFGALASVKKIS